MLIIRKQVGDLVLDKRGIAIKGLLVRHLILPNNIAGTKEIVDFIAKKISPNTFINIMDQYWPALKTHQYLELSRRISSKEYLTAINLAQKAGLKRICG